MRPIFLKNLLSAKEVFWLYRKLVRLPSWALTGHSSYDDARKGFLERQEATIANLLLIKDSKPIYIMGGLDGYGQSIPYRVNERLKEHKLEIPTDVERFWINATFKESSSHWPHQDSDHSQDFSIILFLAPVWNDQWLGSFFCDGEEFKFSPGGAVIFQSTDLHTADNPSLQCPYIRLSANILTREIPTKPV